MNKNKKRIVIVILVTLIVILAIGATFAILYLNTDLFKSDKDLFYKYMVKNEEITKLFDFSELNEYIKKSQSLSHTYNSEIKITSSISDNNDVQSNNSDSNILSVEINGKCDPINQNESFDFKLKYANLDLLDLSAIKNNDLYGILSEEIITKYVAIENNNLKDFVKKLGIENTDEIPDKIKFKDFSENLTLTEEQKNDLFNVYKPILVDKISNDNFTKQKEVPLLLNNNNISTTTYVLTLSKKQCNDILRDILETTKNSEVILNIIKDKVRILGYEENELDQILQSYKDSIQEYIMNLNNENTDDEALKIILYTAENQLLKTDIVIQNSFTFGITFSKNDTQLEVNIMVNAKETTNNIQIQISKDVTTEKSQFAFTINSIADDKQNKIVFKFEKNGSPNSTQIKDAASLGFVNEVGAFRVDYTNIEEYTDSINVEKLDSSNSVTLNNYPSEDILNLIEAILGRTQQVLQDKAIILENTNISTDLLLPLLLIRSDNLLNDTTNKMTSQEVQAFNSQFMLYSGSDSKGSSVKALISSIIANNATYTTDNSKQIALNFGQNLNVTNTEEMENISNQINPSSSYRVILSYSSEGLVNEITIEENE